MTAEDQVRIILRNIEAMGKPYPNFRMTPATRFLLEPEPPPPDDRRHFLASIGCGVSMLCLSSWVYLSVQML